MPQPGQFFVVNEEGQMVAQGAQGGDPRNSDRGGGTARARRGSQQRVGHLVSGGLDQMKEWGSKIVAEVKWLQANQPISSSRRTATEDGGATGQSPGPEQERIRGFGLHGKGVSIWMVTAWRDMRAGPSEAQPRIAS